MNSVDSDENIALSTSMLGGFWKPFSVVSVVVVSLLALLSASVYLWAQQYDGRIPPGVSVVDVDVGGQDPENVRQLLQTQIDTLLTDGIPLTVEGETKTLTFTSLSTTDSVDDLAFDLDALMEDAMASHHSNAIVDSFNMLVSALTHKTLNAPFTIEEDRIKTRIRELFPERETLSQSATFVISPVDGPWTVEAKDGYSGREFVWEPFFSQLNSQLTILDSTAIQLTLMDKQPDVSLEQATSQVDQALAALLLAPYPVVLSPDQTWELTAGDLSTMLAPGADAVTLSQEAFTLWSTTISQEINQAVQDARLVIENGRVTEFVESQNGMTVDVDVLQKDLVSRVQAGSVEPVELVVVVKEPAIKTEDVNDLGIDEILGVGTSSYRGSPTNRRANIQNGVRLLNGILIAPGEEFSLLAALSPFTTENGYLPELVIKGDKIIPELGGGLCQIGTTTFRAVMNSGLPITERQNHSLVVSYYNDPRNGNPGTDATIYEPSPDFKFVNDTGNYILFQAENLTETSDLRFTLWGTSDGRTGSFTPPVVSRWIPVGETQRIETTDMEPGKEQCQSAHIGADSSFTYTIVRPDGTIEETVFTSHYRPLPEICLVGVEEKVVEDGEAVNVVEEKEEVESDF
ncbi:MAG: VanW family protein [Patescibacteria group bacterium]